MIIVSAIFSWLRKITNDIPRLKTLQIVTFWRRLIWALWMAAIGITANARSVMTFMIPYVYENDIIDLEETHSPESLFSQNGAPVPGFPHWKIKKKQYPAPNSVERIIRPKTVALCQVTIINRRNRRPAEILSNTKVAMYKTSVRNRSYIT